MPRCCRVHRHCGACHVLGVPVLPHEGKTLTNVAWGAYFGGHETASIHLLGIPASTQLTVQAIHANAGFGCLGLNLKVVILRCCPLDTEGTMKRVQMGLRADDYICILPR